MESSTAIAGVTWDPDPVRALRGFARETIRERARLAVDAPDAEADAVAPLSSARAHWILLTLEADDAERAAIARQYDHRGGLAAALELPWDRASGVIRCPAHEDHRASLSWRIGAERLLLNCFAGCTFDEIRRAVGL